MVNRLNNHRQLDNLTNLEQTRLSRKSLDLGRIALTTIGYGMVGSLFNNPDIVAPITASIGFSWSLYDEYKHEGMNLFAPAVGIVLGGVVGEQFNINVKLENVLAYTGATIGGALVLYNSWRTRKNQ